MASCKQIENCLSTDIAARPDGIANATITTAPSSFRRAFNDASLMAAYDELRTLLSGPDCPEDVVTACLRLSEHQTKLFVTTLDGYRAGDWAKRIENAGTPDLNLWPLRLEPSNFLRELLAALRAFEWPQVLVLVHGAISDRS